MPDKTWNIVLAEAFSEDAIAKLGAIGTLTQLDSCDEKSLTGALRSCDALLVRTASQVTRRVIESAPNLKVIGRGGVGLDNIDLEAARQRGIPVAFTPHAATDAVADLTMALMLGLIWNLNGNHAAIRSGQFKQARAAAQPIETKGLVLGIIGMGRIGRAVARRAINGFLMEVHYNDIMKPDSPLDFAAESMSKEEVYQSSHVVSLHVPLTPQTRGMINAATLTQFRKGAYLVNTARGAVCNLVDVSHALASGTLGGVGLDVFDPEPPSPSHPILSAPRTIFTPHIGARTARAQDGMNTVVDDVIRVLNGQRPQYAAHSDQGQIVA